MENRKMVVNQIPHLSKFILNSQKFNVLLFWENDYSNCCKRYSDPDFPLKILNSWLRTPLSCFVSDFQLRP